MQIAAVQHAPVWGNRIATMEALAPVVARTAAGGARLLLLPELFATGYLPDGEAMAEPEEGPTSAWMARLAHRHGCWIGGSVAELAPGDDRPGNVFVLCGPDGEAHRYTKSHPFTFAGEDKVFRAGHALLTLEIEGLRITPFVCYDLRFADWFWAAGPATDVFLVPANWPSARHAHWQALLVARAIENQAWVVAANRVGVGGRFDYGGGSCIIDPWGTTVAAAARPVETVVSAKVDAALVAKVRAEFPFLDDRVPPPTW
jgi:predicted amidohydrolase